MTDERMALIELLQKSGESDFLRVVAEAVLLEWFHTGSSTPIPTNHRNSRSNSIRSISCRSERTE